MAPRLLYKTPITPVNTTTPASGLSQFYAAEDHDHGLSGSDFDHGELLGLTDDDHTQYALLAGRSGTNDFTGNIGLTGNLKLPTTTATVGQITMAGSRFIHTFGGGDQNVFVGLTAGNLTHTGIRNTGIGYGVLAALTSGGDNQAIGRLALANLTTGVQNTIIGMAAGVNITTQSLNTAVGHNALNACTADEMSAFGANSMKNATTAIQCASFGSGALSALVDGFFNTAVGTNALQLSVSNSSCSALGRSALAAATGDNNSAIGSRAGEGITTGTNNTFIGMLTVTTLGTITNSTVIGANSTIANSNTIMLGNSSINVCIAGAVPPSTGTKGLIFDDGTALATMASNTAGLYADDIAGNVSMHAINENGDVIKLIKTGTYTPTNVTADRSYDANSTTIDELADVLGTLIADLQLTGILG